MDNNNYKRISLILLLLILIGNQQFFAQTLRGNGNVITEERTISEFNGIIANGSFELFLKQGTAQKVVIEADENLHKLFVVNVRNNNLNIQTLGKAKRAKALKVYVTLVNLNHLLVIGAVDVRTDTTINSSAIDVFVSGISSVKVNLSATSLDCEITDGAYVNLQGNVDNFDLRVTDEAEINAFNLEANKCYAKISGFSDVKINVIESMKLRVTGAGNLYYKGNPKITERISSGTGFIVRRKRD